MKKDKNYNKFLLKLLVLRINLIELNKSRAEIVRVI